MSSHDPEAGVDLLECTWSSDNDDLQATVDKVDRIQDRAEQMMNQQTYETAVIYALRSQGVQGNV